MKKSASSFKKEPFFIRKNKLSIILYYWKFFHEALIMKSNQSIINLLLASTVIYTTTQKNKSKHMLYANPNFRANPPSRSETPTSPMLTPSPNPTNVTSSEMATTINNTMNITPSTNETEMMDSETLPDRSQLLQALYAADSASNMNPTSTGPFTLPPLEYDFDALEPYIDERTLRIHHQKLHKAYVDNLNAALSRHPEFYGATLDQLLIFPDRLPSDIQTQVTNNAGGHYNHSLMWKVMDPSTKSRPTGEFAKAVSTQFGSFENLKRNLKTAGESVFGSGYAYLALNPYGRLIIVTTSNEATPVPLRTIPLLPIDMWEHAYYLKHQDRRSDYIDDYFNVINWERVGARYEAASQVLTPPPQ